MNDTVRNKVAKVYQLVNRGEAGEKEAAKMALDRLMKRYNLSSEELESLKLKSYRFKYKTVLDMWLFQILIDYFLEDNKAQIYKSTLGCRELDIKLEYLDYIILSTSYEYFKSHMANQYRELCLPLIKRCRTPKTKAKRREELQQIFFSNYIIASQLYKPHQISKIDTSKLTDKERKDRAVLDNVEGGNYKTQVTTGLYLE